MSQRDAEILRDARLHFESSHQKSSHAALPDPGWRWESYCIAARRLFGRYKTPLQAIHYIQAPSSNSGFEARFVGEALSKHAETMERNCSEIFPQFADKLESFCETDLSFAETVTECNGRLVSSPLYNHILHTMRCVSLHPEATRILEIGGGYGAPGRVWMTNEIVSPELYISVDFPETLFYAEVYLRATMPEIEVRYLVGDDLPNHKGSGPEIWLCPISNLSVLRDTKIDIVTNTGSLQEMSESYVEFYMNAIEELSTDRFYTANYFAQPVDALKESMNFAAPIMGPHWEAEYLEHSNDRERGVLEAFYVRRDLKGQPPLNAADDVSNIGTIDTPAAFAKLFDALRQTKDPAIIMDGLSKALVQMPYVPKEAVFLAQMAYDLASPITTKDEALKRLLDDRAASARENAGIVDPTVDEIRAQLMKGERVAEIPTGSITTTESGLEVEIEGKPRVFRIGSFGSVEQMEQQGQGVFLSGWVADRDLSEGAKAVHVFDGDRLIETFVPASQRPEFEMGDVPIGFHGYLPVVTPDSIYLLVEFSNGDIGDITQPNEHLGLAC